MAQRLPPHMRNKYKGDPNNATHIPTEQGITAKREKYTLSTDPKIASGQISGLERAEQLYGMNPDQIGSQTQEIIGRRRQAMDQDDPSVTGMRQERNRRLRTARASGASEDQIRQIEREGSVDIANQEFSTKEQALSQYQKLIGNILGGTSSMEMGMAGIEKSGQQPAYRPPSGGISVICTELHRQGYMSDEILKKDGEYGNFIRRTNPNVYFGYLVFALPIVALMQRSKTFTKLVSIPAMAWARNMAGKKNIFGKLISMIGEPICGFTGRMLEVYCETHKVTA